jgi:hypothetical protein
MNTTRRRNQGDGAAGYQPCGVVLGDFRHSHGLSEAVLSGGDCHFTRSIGHAQATETL